MKIRIDGENVEFEPETQMESMELETLFKKMGGGLREDIHLVADGIYARRIDASAKFRLEGLSAGDTKPGLVMPFDGEVYCYTCGKRKQLKQGDPIPMCCGKPMEII